MSYIQVDDVEQAIATANQMGGKVELGPEPFGSNNEGRIALIRDPLGAGFTVYEGPDLKGRDLRGNHGRMGWNELIISDITAVQPFYEALFGWNISRVSGSNRFEVKDQTGQLVSHIEQVPNEIKGDLEFWVIYFAVSDLDQAAQTVTRHGGTITSDDASSGTRQLMIADPQGAALILIEGRSGGQSWPTWGSGNFKWRSILGLLLVFCAVFFDWGWIWPILFLLWIIPDLFSGVTFFLEPVYRHENPILFWLIAATWISLSIYPLLELMSPV